MTWISKIERAARRGSDGAFQAGVFDMPTIGYGAHLCENMPWSVFLQKCASGEIITKGTGIAGQV